MNSSGAVPGVRQVREERRSDAPLFVHPEWSEAFPWLVQGTTGREAGSFSRAGSATAAQLDQQWRSLRGWAGISTAVLGRQVHGATIIRHREMAPGLLLAEAADGHITAASGVLLAVSVADCVPVFLVQPHRRTVALLHAGWRGLAAGIMTRCIETIGSDSHVHFGPAICGACYEVGPEVHQALGLGTPGCNRPVDLRAVLVAQCQAKGVRSDHMTVSAWCTRCEPSPFFSHRAGHAERQVGVIGMS